MRSTIKLIALAAVLLTTTTQAQTSAARVSPAPEPNGIVTGRVFCADTGSPARLATVSLISVAGFPESMSTTNLHHLSAKPTPRVDVISVQTALDGSYTLTHVAPGAYYVAASKVGYINLHTLVSQKQVDSSSERIRSLIDKVAPRVTVEPNSIAHVDVQLQRGAAVSGTITYDDGAPASNVRVAVSVRNEKGEWTFAPHATMSLNTDDRGYFRLISLMPGTYGLEATLNLDINETHSIPDSTNRSQSFTGRTAQSAITFYGNGTPFIDQAATFTLRGDEQRTGQDMTLPISKLHKLTGRVAAGANGHFANCATVELISTTNRKVIASTNIDNEDSLFRFELVPEGDYTLHITNVWDVGSDPDGGQSVLKTYGDVDMPLILRGDMLDITATVSAKQNNQSTDSN
jgi:hypothetical protein